VTADSKARMSFCERRDAIRLTVFSSPSSTSIRTSRTHMVDHSPDSRSGFDARILFTPSITNTSMRTTIVDTTRAIIRTATPLASLFSQERVPSRAR